MRIKPFCHSFFIVGCLVFALVLALPVYGQTEVTGQNKIAGIHSNGEIVPFKANIRLAEPGWKAVYSTDEPGEFMTQYVRDGKKQTLLSSIQGVRFEQAITDVEAGSNKMLIVLYADTTKWIEGAFFCIELPADIYGKGTVDIGNIQTNIAEVTLTDPKKCLMQKSKLVRVEGDGCSLELNFNRDMPAFICKEPSGNAVIYLSLTEGKLLMKDNSLQFNFTMLAKGGTTLPVEYVGKETDKVVEPTAGKTVGVNEEPVPEKAIQSSRSERTGGYAIANASNSNSLTEVMAWGNMTGIRVNGVLMAFETSFRLVEPGWKMIHSTGKERQSFPDYTRNGQQQTVVTNIKKVRYEQTVTDTNTGRNNVSVSVRADTTMQTEGTYFCLELPADRYAQGKVSIGGATVAISNVNETEAGKYPSFRGAQIQIEGMGRSLKLEFRSTVTAFLRRELSGNVTIYIELMSGKSVKKGNSYQCQFAMQATGEIDNEKVEVAINRTQPGRLFDGLGGNFRLQNPRQDEKVINYCLDNMRVAWGRVEMPWRYWQPEEDADPISDAQSGKIDERVMSAMKMAQRLKAKGMPVVVSAWFPPVWAIDGDPANYKNQGGVIAYQLNPRKKEKIYKSITDYLVYLKQEYGVEAAMYSFNESDLGIDVLFSPREHAIFIKELGAYMASRGLATKLLLGDNSDATTFDFVVPAMNDPETYPYIGALSFHSWRGCDDATLHKWADASRKLNVPLIVGEGSTDAAAWRYPQIFGESTFALYEINLYIRICAICQPQSILQWQLTSDYSILLGDGIFGTDGPLRRTQRYWNLKQLASTPEQSFAIPFTCSKEQVNCAAFGNIARGEYAVHMVNNGTSRPATIKGLPEKTADVKVYVTTSDKGMEELKNVVLNHGTITFELPATSFATVITTL